MFKNYLKVALRNLFKQRGYTFINVSGLAIGMACCILIFLFIRDEWKYDDFHEKRDSIYSLTIQETRPDGSLQYRRLIPLGVPEALVKEFPGIKSVVQLVSGDVTIIHSGTAFREQIFEADSTFFHIFSFPLLAGDANKVLSHPSDMVVSEAIAQKYFGNDLREGYQNVLGKTLTIGGLQDFRVSGVMANCPDNSSLQINILIPFRNYAQLPLGSNDIDGRTSTYVLLDARQEATALEQALQPFTLLHFENRIETYQDRGLLAPRTDALQLKLQPLRDLHLSPEVPVSYEQPTHNPLYSYILSAIALLVLLIGCINFTTLSVARSAGRAREVGMRKAVGALKKQLMAQFCGEALLLAFLASLLGLAIAVQFMPLFNELTGKTLSLADLGGSATVALFGLTLLVGLLAGGYPAAVMSRFQPVRILKGDTGSGGANRFTRFLVAIQFTGSIALMLCAIIMGNQLVFLQEKDLGYNDDLIVVFRSRSAGSAETLEKYRNSLSGVVNVTHVVGAGQAFSRSEDTRLWSDAGGNTRIAHVYGVDYDYVDMMEMELRTGRNFSRAFAADPRTGVLVNETLVREFGLQDPIGKTLQGFMPGLFPEPPVILGVVKDFNFKSLHQAIKPAVLTMHPDYWARFRNVFVKIRPENMPATLGLLKEKWSEIAPDVPFDYFFLDADIQKQYQSEQRWLLIMRYATILALAIACMGLFGLAMLMANKRTKEVGIRKVLGASVPNLFLLLSRDFTRLVFLAFVVAAPLGYYAMHGWLQSFAYRVEIGLSTFLLVGGLAFCSVLLTVSYQAIKTALANPVDSLRYE